MKYWSVVLALAASSNAAFCNGGWGKPAGASCPSGYSNTYCCEEPGSPSNSFPTYRTCVSPSSGNQPVLSACQGSVFVRCCP
ncbi:hypothetical protein CcaCcLH18_13029 [Colletotrichum camelliae]|nr:hypothetical protein CcaCcLH18_13029 [Colletotrichum camelliae]